MVEEGPLCVFQTQISHEDLHEHTNPSLLVEDENGEQNFNQSQKLAKIAVCNDGLNRQEEDKDSKWDLSLCFLESEILCQEEIILLD